MIELEDGTILKDEQAAINCNSEGAVINGGNANSSSAWSGKYLLQAFFHITQENIGKLASEKIIKVQLHDLAKMVNTKEADHIVQYISCLVQVKE